MSKPKQITTPGIYDILAEDYHRDPCPEPSLSSGIARKLVRQSPLHAWTAHPRFGGADITASRMMDVGSAIHAWLLGYPDKISRIGAVYGPKTRRKELIGLPVTSYQSQDAQDERDDIRCAGGIPLLAHEWTAVKACVRDAEAQIKTADDGAGFFAPGRSEAVVVARDGDVWLRCMVDRLPDDRRFPPYDLKGTNLSAAPGGWERRLQTEYAFQDAFYRRVIRLAGGYDPEPMRFVVVEMEPPHGVVIMAAAPALADIAEREVDRAIRRWRDCLKTDQWPGYPPHTAWVEPTSWQMTDADAAEMRDQFALASADNPFA